MASSCPSREEAIAKMQKLLYEVAAVDASKRGELTDLNETITEGNNIIMELRSGFKKRGGKKYRGGMPPAKRNADDMLVPEPEPVVLTPAAKNELLKVLAHLITIGAMTGGTYAISCYISPALEAYLVGKGMLTGICTGPFEWTARALLGTPFPNLVDTCSTIQQKYNVFVAGVTTFTGVSTMTLFTSRNVIKQKYNIIQEAVYNKMASWTEKIAAKMRARMAVADLAPADLTPAVLIAAELDEVPAEIVAQVNGVLEPVLENMVQVAVDDGVQGDVVQGAMQDAMQDDAMQGAVQGGRHRRKTAHRRKTTHLRKTTHRRKTTRRRKIVRRRKTNRRSK
jgi:hypothetical protein